MSSPSSRLSFSSGGPSRSLLQRLLEEIDGDQPQRTLPRAGSLSYGPSRASSISLSRHSSPSIWVGGNSVAEDARRKLRALDERRQKRQSTTEMSSGQIGDTSGDECMPTRSSLELSEPLSSTKSNTVCPAFKTMEFRHAATWSQDDELSPTAESPQYFTNNKREFDPSETIPPETVPKRTRTQKTCEHYSTRSHGSSDGGDMMLRGGGPTTISSSHTHQPRFRERKTHSESTADADQFEYYGLFSSETVKDATPSLGVPTTPRRSMSRMDGSDSPMPTPAWMKPFHLVDEDKSIYMNVHGEDWKDHALCLQCFRRHGSFNRILPSGCEVCGQDEALKGHFWEFPDRE